MRILCYLFDDSAVLCVQFKDVPIVEPKIMCEEDLGLWRKFAGVKYVDHDIMNNGFMLRVGCDVSKVQVVKAKIFAWLKERDLDVVSA